MPLRRRPSPETIADAMALLRAQGLTEASGAQVAQALAQLPGLPAGTLYGRRVIALRLREAGWVRTRRGVWRTTRG